MNMQTLQFKHEICYYNKPNLYGFMLNLPIEIPYVGMLRNLLNHLKLIQDDAI